MFNYKRKSILGRNSTITATHPALKATYYINQSNDAYKIDWNRIDTIMDLVYSVLQNKYPIIIKNLKSWYLPIAHTELQITDPLMVDWFKRGFTIIRSVIDAIQKEQKIITNQINLIQSKSGSIQAKDVALKPLKQKYQNLTDLSDILLGCRAQLGQWFWKIYELLSAMYPQDNTLKNAERYFGDICIKLRFEALKS